MTVFTSSSELRVALIGVSRIAEDVQSRLEPDVKRVGRALGRRRALVFTGACGGLPLVAGREAAEAGATVIGCSPGRNMSDHVETYDSPTEGFRHLLFVGNGLSARQEFMIRQSNVVFALGGNIGTLCEALTAIKEQRPIVVTEDVGNIARVLRFALEQMDVYPRARIQWVRLAEMPAIIESWEPV